MTFEALYWIRGVAEPEDIKPRLVGINGDMMHWGGGRSYCTWMPEHWVIVREFPCEDSESVIFAREELEKAYAPTPQPPCARLGFVSPEGHFYPCGYCCHHDLEYKLGQQFYQNGYQDLRRKGWVSFVGNAIIGVRDEDCKISQATKDTARKIVEEFEHAERVNPEINWHKILLANPECYEEQNWFTGPTDRIDDFDEGKTYASKLRECYEMYFGEPDLDVPIAKTPLITPADRVRRPNEHPGD